MNIYLVRDITRPLGSHDGYDSFVVVAEDEQQAKYTNPCVHHPGPSYIGTETDEEEDELDRMLRPVGAPLSPEINDFWTRIGNGILPNGGRWPHLDMLDKEVEVTLLGKPTPEQDFWHIVCVSYNQP